VFFEGGGIAMSLNFGGFIGFQTHSLRHFASSLLAGLLRHFFFRFLVRAVLCVFGWMLRLHVASLFSFSSPLCPLRESRLLIIFGRLKKKRKGFGVVVSMWFRLMHFLLEEYS
jgi:hypothetical protein